MLKLLKGIDSLYEISKLTSHFGYKKILLVTGKSSFSSCGAKKIIDQEFSSEDLIHFSDFEVNPKLEDAIRGAKLAREKKIDLILSIGGGSVLDMSKLIKAFYNKPNKESLILDGLEKFSNHDMPIIAVPTTAGSGSEATHFAVVYRDGAKYSLADKSLKPDAVILDGGLVKSASKYQKACNALDALSQSIESAWAVSSDKDSLKISMKAIEMCSKNIKKYVNTCSDYQSQKMLEASNLAGEAINVTKTTAAHAWSYGFTSIFNIPHGHAVWLTLPKIFQIHLNADSNSMNDPRGAKNLREIAKNIKDILNLNSISDDISIQLEEFLNSIGIFINMEYDLGLNAKQRKELSTMVNIQRMSNNPVSFEQEKINYIFDL